MIFRCSLLPQAALDGTDVLLAECVLLLRRHRFAYPEVTYIGKGATFVLMYAFPLLLLVEGEFATHPVSEAVRPLAYAFMIWGGVLYVWSGVLYAIQTGRSLRPRGG
jgi:cardiolipin synthase